MNLIFNWTKRSNALYLIISSSILVLILFFFSTIDNTIVSYTFYTTITLLSTDILIGIDMISFYFILLTALIMPLCILFNFHVRLPVKDQKLFFSLFLLIELLLIQVFTVLDIVWFYILFEFLLVPFYLIIVSNNLSVKMTNKKFLNRKINAFLLLFFYTIISSFFMLISILLLYTSAGSTSLPVLTYILLPSSMENLLWVLIFMSLSIKIPIMPFHIWLPEAHVESPTEASVILAAIILKIGAYGMLRILVPLFTQATLYYNNVVWLFSICTVIFSCMNALVQLDVKRIIAYASIGHMNVCILGLFSLDIDIISGSYLMMIGHGFISGGLFFAIGSLYNRLHTKNLNYIKGLMHLLPGLSVILLLLLLSNNALPGTVNFIGEIMVLNFCYKNNIFFLFVAFVCGIFFTNIYGFILANKLLYGLPLRFVFASSCLDISVLELCVFMPLIAWAVLCGIFPQFVLLSIHQDFCVYLGIT